MELLFVIIPPMLLSLVVALIIGHVVRNSTRLTKFVIAVVCGFFSFCFWHLLLFGPQPVRDLELFFNVGSLPYLLIVANPTDAQRKRKPSGG